MGAADPSNVVEEIGRGSETLKNYTNASGTNALEILEQLKASGANVNVASGASPGGKGTGRRRKA